VLSRLFTVYCQLTSISLCMSAIFEWDLLSRLMNNSAYQVSQFPQNVSNRVSVCMSMTMSVRLSVPSQIPDKYTSKLNKIFAHADRGPGSVLLWRRCDMLSTSGFVNNVTFSHNGSYSTWSWQYGVDVGARCHKFPTYSPVGATLTYTISANCTQR